MNMEIFSTILIIFYATVNVIVAICIAPIPEELRFKTCILPYFLVCINAKEYVNIAGRILLCILITPFVLVYFIFSLAIVVASYILALCIQGFMFLFGKRRRENEGADCE